MLNRQITVGFEKSKKDKTISDDGSTIEIHYATARKAFEGGSLKIMKMVATYVALDTARKVVVNRLSK
jgi:transcriptional regulatory protein LevR